MQIVEQRTTFIVFIFFLFRIYAIGMILFLKIYLLEHLCWHPGDYAGQALLGGVGMTCCPSRRVPSGNPNTASPIEFWPFFHILEQCIDNSNK
jgi:hypothetical protein